MKKCSDNCKVIEAIKAFEELDFVQEHKKMPVTLDLTSCDNAISRQAAIEAFQMFREYESNRSNKEWVDRIETVLNQLPPVNPQPKTGYWIAKDLLYGGNVLNVVKSYIQRQRKIDENIMHFAVDAVRR